MSVSSTHRSASKALPGLLLDMLRWEGLRLRRFNSLTTSSLRSIRLLTRLPSSGTGRGTSGTVAGLRSARPVERLDMAGTTTRRARKLTSRR